MSINLTLQYEFGESGPRPVGLNKLPMVNYFAACANFRSSSLGYGSQNKPASPVFPSDNALGAQADRNQEPMNMLSSFCMVIQ